MMATQRDRALSELVRLAHQQLDGSSPIREEVLFARFEARAASLRARPRRARGVWLGALGGVSAALVAGALWFSFRSPELTYEVVNGSVAGSGYVVGGAGTRIQFSDGSELTLAPGAQTRVTELGRHGGRVSLEKGEVRVAIAKKPEAAWTVEAGPYSVRVTGTAFDVSWSRQDQVFEIKMQSGSVVVTGPLVGSGIPLRAGQRMVGKDGRLTVDGRDMQRPTAALPAEPAVEERALPESSQRVAGTGSDARTGSDWNKQVAQGNFQQVLNEAEQRGLDRTIATASLAELSALADAARYARRSDLARRVLLAKRQRFAGTAAAREAAFFLGRLAEDGGGNALEWYDRYLSESPRGTYASQALGRKMMLVYRQSGEAAARSIASDYLARYPKGPYASAASKIVNPASSSAP